MSIVDQAERHECWTIEVEPSPAIVAQSRGWRTWWRGDYHKFTQALFYEAVNAIQKNLLHKRRPELELEEGCARYFFRRDRRERHRIRITIERIHFFHPDGDFDPDPHDGETALHPFEPLVIDLSNADRRFTVDYIEGVWLKPRRTDSLDRIESIYSEFRDDDARIPTSSGHRGGRSIGSFAIERSVGFRADQLPNAAVEVIFIKSGSWRLLTSPEQNSFYVISDMQKPIDALIGQRYFAPDHEMKYATISSSIDVLGIPQGQQLPNINFINSMTRSMQQVYPSGAS